MRIHEFTPGTKYPGIMREAFSSDIPNADWLRGKQEYAQQRGRNSFGVPYMGTVTGSFSEPVILPVSMLRRLPGMRGEQKNVRQDDLAAIKKIMQSTGRLPQHNGRDYVPFINVAWNGEAWVNEGNHRIMAAAELGWDKLPVEVRYFDGGELADGPLNPKDLGLRENNSLDEDRISNERVRRIQNFLNDKFNANLDVDGVLGPLTLKTIDKFMPDARKRLAPEPDKNTNVQGLKNKSVEQELEEDLRKWFREKWVRFGPDGKIRGACARGSSSEGKPKCLPQAKAHALGKKGRKYAAAKKRREDPNPERRGAAKNVATRKEK